MSRTLVVMQFVLIAIVAWPTAAMRWSIPGVALLAAAGLLFLWCLSANRPGNFNIRPDPKPAGTLVTSGPYRHMRHPMYVAVVLFALGGVACAPSWQRAAATLALVGVLHAKVLREERAMRALHPDYAAYCARTARYIPRVL